MTSTPPTMKQLYGDLAAHADSVASRHAADALRLQDAQQAGETTAHLFGTNQNVPIAIAITDHLNRYLQLTQNAAHYRQMLLNL